MLTFGAPLPIADIKALGDGEYRVSGYASTFGNVDLGNDVVMPGAFDRTLKDGHKIRFLAHHRPDQVLGVPEHLKVDKKGLFGQWKIVPTQLGEETYQLLKAGALDSFSIGYVVKDSEFADNGEVRQLKDIELLECSVVSIPMNPEAVVTAVKQWAEGFEQASTETPNVEQPLEDLLAEETTRIKGVLAHIGALYVRRKDEFRTPTDGHKQAVTEYRAEVEALWRAIDQLSEQADEAKASRVRNGDYRLALELRRRKAVALGIPYVRTPAHVDESSGSESGSQEPAGEVRSH